MILLLRNALRRARPLGLWPALVFVPLLLITAATARPTGQVVRNHTPEQPVFPADEQWPVACPRSLAETMPVMAMERDSPEHHLKQFLNFHAVMRYEDALPWAQRLVEVAPDRPLSHYNHACVLARLGRADEASAAITRAVDTGWRNSAHTVLDPDLRSLHSHQGFQLNLVRMQDLARAERIPAIPPRTEAWDLIADDLAAAAPDLLHRYRVPGAVIALIQDGRCVWLEAFGDCDARSGQRLSTDHRFVLRTPIDLVALCTAAVLEQEGRVSLTPLMRQALTEADRINGRQGRRSHMISRRSLADRSPSASHQTLTPATAHVQTVWPSVLKSGRGLEMVQAAVEVAGGASFADVCGDRILEPLDIAELLSDPAGRADLSPGHSRLGSLLAAEGADSQMSATTALELAQVVELLMLQRDEPLTQVMPDEAVEAIIELARADLGSAGLHVRRAAAEGEVLLEAAEVSGGSGCLLRWHPYQGRGVVILFNSETGPEAALRLAQLALGG